MYDLYTAARRRRNSPLLFANEYSEKKSKEQYREVEEEGKKDRASLGDDRTPCLKKQIGRKQDYLKHHPHRPTDALYAPFRPP